MIYFLTIPNKIVIVVGCHKNPKGFKITYRGV